MIQPKRTPAEILASHRLMAILAHWWDLQAMPRAGHRGTIRRHQFR